MRSSRGSLSAFASCWKDASLCMTGKVSMVGGEGALGLAFAPFLPFFGGMMNRMRKVCWSGGFINIHF